MDFQYHLTKGYFSSWYVHQQFNLPMFGFGRNVNMFKIKKLIATSKNMHNHDIYLLYSATVQQLSSYYYYILC